MVLKIESFRSQNKNEDKYKFVCLVIKFTGVVVLDV